MSLTLTQRLFRGHIPVLGLLKFPGTPIKVFKTSCPRLEGADNTHTQKTSLQREPGDVPSQSPEEADGGPEQVVAQLVSQTLTQMAGLVKPPC